MKSTHTAQNIGRILVLAAILLSAFNLRTAVTSLTPLLDDLSAIFSFGATMMGVLGMLPSLAFAIFGAFTPLLFVRRLGLERTILLAMLLAGGGLLARSFSESTNQLMWTSMMALAGMGIGNVVLPPLVKRYFPQKIGLVSTSYITVLQVGTVSPALLAVPLALELGWRFALGVWSFFALTAAAIWIVILWRLRQHSRQQAAIVVSDETLLEQSLSPSRMLPIWRSPLAWGMMLMFGTTSLMSYAMFTWLPTLLIEAGANQVYAGVMLALYASMGIVVSLIVPYLASRMRQPFFIVLVAMVLTFIAFVGLYFAPLAAPVVWVILLGLGPAAFPLALTLINLRTRTSAGSAALSGFVQGLGYIISCLGPLLFGVLHDWSHAWLWPFAFLAIAVVVMTWSGWYACRQHFLEDELAS